MELLAYFENLTISDIHDFVSRKQEEHLQLDFKTIKSAELSSKDDKRNLACSVSGFANSSGGIIVWGVNASKGEDQIDCAQSLSPISNVELFVTRLNSLTGDCVVPMVNGIKHRSIIQDGVNGFAVTIIPESDTGPHMAKLGENRFYKRSGDGIYQMEHYDIADMFGKRRRPKLGVFYKIINWDENMEVHLGIENTGRATARALYFAFSTNSTLQRSEYGLDGNRNEGLPLLKFRQSEYMWTYSGGIDFALHPGMTHKIAALNLGIDKRAVPKTDVVIDYVLACEDQQIEKGKILIPLGELFKFNGYESYDS